jgi:universal stress protein A
MKTATLRTPRSTKSSAAVLTPFVRIRSILVPVDFSHPSLKALDYAVALAEQFDARITLLYVSEPVTMPDFAGSFPLAIENETLLAAFKEKLEALRKKNVHDPELIEKVVVRQGRAFHEITEAARTLKSDLIVISTHGYSGFSRAILGSVTERVVRRAPCPVLVVREHQHEIISG